jgi:hypothetical protein
MEVRIGDNNVHFLFSSILLPFFLHVTTFIASPHCISHIFLRIYIVLNTPQRHFSSTIDKGRSKGQRDRDSTHTGEIDTPAFPLFARG